MKAPGCSNLKQAAGHYLGRQIEALDQHLADCRSADNAEAVHQARIACKRIDQALATYDSCFKKKSIGKWHDAVTDMTRRLGKARDLDIHILRFEHSRNAIVDDRPELASGIDQLIARLREQRSAMQPKIKKTASGVIGKNGNTGDKHPGDIAKLKRAAAKAEGTKRCCKRGYCKKLRQYAAQTTLKKLKQYNKLQTTLDDRDDIKGHHRFRLAAKQLRYTLEITSPYFNNRLKPFIDAVKSLQDLLGKLHDTDNSLDLLASFADKKQAETASDAIAYLIDLYREERAGLFEQTRQMQHQLDQGGLLNDLKQLLRDKTS